MGFKKKLYFKVCHTEELTFLVYSFINFNINSYSTVTIRIQNSSITLYTPSHYPLVMGQVGFIVIISALCKVALTWFISFIQRLFVHTFLSERDVTIVLWCHQLVTCWEILVGCSIFCTGCSCLHTQNALGHFLDLGEFKLILTMAKEKYYCKGTMLLLTI